MDKKWYVYRHIRLDKNEPFYVGIGCTAKYKRAFEIDPSKRNKIWNDITNKSKWRVDIIFDELSKEGAAAKEQEFISLYGRKDLNTGCLCNMTDGGDGVWNIKISDETRAKISNSKKGFSRNN